MTTPLILQERTRTAPQRHASRPVPLTVTHLPARFDAHAVARWVRPEPASHQSIDIDAGAVRFIDEAGLDALQELVDRAVAVHATIRIRNLSPAAGLTMEFCQAHGLLGVAR